MEPIHHAESWLFFPTFDNRYDCGDPRYSGLYGFIREKNALPNKAFPDEAKELLLGMGNWLQVNGDAIYGTTPWFDDRHHHFCKRKRAIQNPILNSR